MMWGMRWTLWQMLLVIGLVIGTAVALVDGIHVWLPIFTFPALLPLLVVVAADAVTTQRIVAHERMSFGEQGTLRSVELVLLLVAIRIASLAGEDAPPLAVMTTWLRDPLAFFGGAFGFYLLPALFTWLFATLVSSAVLEFQAEMPSPNVRSQPFEEAAYLEERAERVSRFDRYWLFATLLALAGATAALFGVSLVAAVQRWTTARPLLAVLGVVFAGLLLHSQGRFTQLVYGWTLDQVSVAPDVSRRYRRSSGGLTVLSLCLGLLLGGVALFAPPPPLLPLLNGLLVMMTLLLALTMGLLSLLLLPLAWLLSLLSGRSAPAPPAIPEIPPPQVAQLPGERPLLPALIFWGCVLLLVGLAALRYLQQRQDLRALLARWPGLRWLMRILGGLWVEAQAWSAHATAVLRERLARRRRPPQRRTLPVGGTRGQLRALYRRLIEAAEQGGVRHAPSQTPYEFRAALGTAVPPVDPDVQAITDVYVLAEYGPGDPQADEVRRARRAWRRASGILGRASASGGVRKTRRRR